MTQPPERDTPAKLVPGEPLWGTSSISGRSTSAGDPDIPSGPHPGHPPRITGTARPVSPAEAPPAAAAPPPGPVRFGATPTPVPGPAAAGYGQGRTYGSGAGHRETTGYPQAGRATRAATTPSGDGQWPDAPRRSSTPRVAVTAVLCFLLGAAAGFAAGWLLI